MLRPIIATILIIAAGSLGWVAYTTARPTASGAHAGATTTKLLVATQPLQAGTLLKDADFREREVPGDAVQDGTFNATDDARTEIRGAMLRRYLDIGDPVRKEDVLRPRDRGFLAAVLAPGTRAISIGVDAKTGASGLISPGDLVDIILDQALARPDRTASHRIVAEAVLNMIRVIAVDQQIAQGAPPPVAPVAGAGAARVASTVTLQVTPEQAARVVVAERLGQLTLIVRSIDGDRGTAQPIANAEPRLFAERAAEPSPPSALSVSGTDVSAALLRDEPSTGSRLRLIQGDTVTDVVFR